MLKRLLSWAAQYTPGVFYYSATLKAKINGAMREMPLSDEAGSTALTRASLAMCCAVSDELKPGDTAEITMTQAEHGGTVIGDFVVNIKRT